MSAKLTLSGSGYGKVFMGTGEEAEKAGEGDYIQAEESADGKNVFEIPVEALESNRQIKINLKDFVPPRKKKKLNAVNG